MKEEEQQSYWVVIPTKLFFDGKSNKNIKGLYGLISSLAQKKGYCYASNNYLSKTIGVSVKTIKRWINELERLNYVKRDYNKEKDNKSKRKIFINGEWGVGTENVPTGRVKKAGFCPYGSGQKGGKMTPYSKKDSKNDSPEFHSDKQSDKDIKKEASEVSSSDGLLPNGKELDDTKDLAQLDKTKLGDNKKSKKKKGGDSDVAWDTHAKLYQYLNSLDSRGNKIDTDEAKKFKILAYYVIISKQRITNKEQWDSFVKRNIRIVTKLVKQGWDVKRICETALMLEAKGISWGLEAIERWLPRLEGELEKRKYDEEVRYEELYEELKDSVNKLNNFYKNGN